MADVPVTLEMVLVSAHIDAETILREAIHGCAERDYLSSALPAGPFEIVINGDGDIVAIFKPN
jgi:hypothetical protein